MQVFGEFATGPTMTQPAQQGSIPRDSSSSPLSGETLRYFLIGATLVWFFPALVYATSSRPYGACVNASGAALTFAVLQLWTHRKISYKAGVRGGLGVSLLVLVAESFLVGQGDSQSA